MSSVGWAEFQPLAVRLKLGLSRRIGNSRLNVLLFFQPPTALASPRRCPTPRGTLGEMTALGYFRAVEVGGERAERTPSARLTRCDCGPAEQLAA